MVYPETVREWTNKRIIQKPEKTPVCSTELTNLFDHLSRGVTGWRQRVRGRGLFHRGVGEQVMCPTTQCS